MNKCIFFLSFAIILAAVGTFCFVIYAVFAGNSWQIISRDEWKARLPTSQALIVNPVSYVIIHHSYNPGICLTIDACKASMRSMQNYHMDGHGWADIGYNFAVGADGNVYVGRGFSVVGAHAPSYNDKSLGLLLIGNFMEKTPPAPMVQVAQEFIEYAIEHGHVLANYTLYGHRQVKHTECPGDAFYSELKTWSHWKEN